jgi:hypothetical protein
MALIFARIRVSDVDAWRAAFAEADALRREHGIVTREIYRDATYHDGLILLLDAADLEAAQRFYHAAEQSQRMARSGLERPAEMWMATSAGAPAA